MTAVTPKSVIIHLTYRVIICRRILSQVPLLSLYSAVSHGPRLPGGKGEPLQVPPEQGGWGVLFDNFIKVIRPL